MALYGTILCAIDFSDPSRDALRAGLRLARRVGARVVVVHVVDLLLAEAAATRADEPGLIRRTEEELASFAAAESVPEGTRTRVLVGSPHEGLLAAAREEGAGLIVMGTHGLGGLKKLFFGSVTEQVLRHTRLPVLAVTRSASVEGASLDVTRVLAAVDLDASAARVLREAAALASALGVPLSVMHVTRDVHAAPPLAETAASVLAARRGEEASRLDGLVADAGCKDAGTVVAEGSPAEQIAQAASARHGTVVAIGLGGHGVFHRPGSIAYRVLCISSALVLAVPDRDERAR